MPARLRGATGRHSKPLRVHSRSLQTRARRHTQARLRNRECGCRATAARPPLSAYLFFCSSSIARAPARVWYRARARGQGVQSTRPCRYPRGPRAVTQTQPRVRAYVVPRVCGRGPVGEPTNARVRPRTPVRASRYRVCAARACAPGRVKVPCGAQRAVHRRGRGRGARRGSISSRRPPERRFAQNPGRIWAQDTGRTN